MKQVEVLIKVRADGSLLACCPSLPGCQVIAKDEDQLRKKMTVAVRSYLASLDSHLQQVEVCCFIKV
jgi:predicted RNase H-like HicB family nuclease